MIPEELNEIFKKYDHEDFDLSVTKIEYSPDELRIVFSFESKIDQFDFNQNWELQVVGDRKNKISFDFGSAIRIVEDHPLLWEFKDTQCELYFNGRCSNPALLFVDLYKIHLDLFGSYKHFETNTHAYNFYALLQAENGMLAQGPKKLLVKYAECIKNHGMDFSIIGERPPSYWNGKEYIRVAEDIKILFVTDTDGFIIAQDFIFTRLD